jgi:DNA polymerase sigma
VLGFTGENSTAIVTKLIEIFQVLRPMLLILKLYLYQQQLNDPSNGGLGGYSLALMIVSFLQVCLA